ncbi:MAG: cellulase family glycosylhydrolase [Candidatus Hinthialibacter antarcticus]|nr:cellulase family glycosylhydrolase [Candidatus Hinthialibacter antarcticus]
MKKLALLVVLAFFSVAAFAETFAWELPLRGVTGNLSLNDDDLRHLAQDWNVNSVRLMLMSGDVRHPEPPYYILDHKLEEIDHFLESCEKYGIRCILDVHETPGRVEWRGEKDRRLWTSFEFHQYLIETWEVLAKRYADKGPVIAGYDLFNEPNMYEEQAGAPSDWNLLVKKLVQAIRKHDKTHPIIIEPTRWGGADGFETLEPVDDPLVIYSFHFYVPHKFTHQRVGDNQGTYIYPGEVEGKPWDKQALLDAMQPAIEFQQKTGAPMYVGEFSAIRWAPDGSALRYLKEVVGIFEQNGWHWSYHAYREWQGWSLEHQGPIDKPETVKSTPRLEFMKKIWAKNEMDGKE